MIGPIARSSPINLQILYGYYPIGFRRTATARGKVNVRMPAIEATGPRERIPAHSVGAASKILRSFEIGATGRNLLHRHTAMIWFM